MMCPFESIEIDKIILNDEPKFCLRLIKKPKGKKKSKSWESYRRWYCITNMNYCFFMTDTSQPFVISVINDPEKWD